MATDKKPHVKWIKFGKDTEINTLTEHTVMLHTSLFILFVPTTSTGHQKKLYRADGPHRGDGVQCLTGHRNLPCFAFAEKCRDPRILIVMYPVFHIIKQVPRALNSKYLKIAFNDLEYLVAAVQINTNVEYSVWNWRIDQKLCTALSPITDPDQTIEVALGYPLHFVQASNNESKLRLWEIYRCCKDTFINSNEITFRTKIKAPFSYTWCPDRDLFVYDSDFQLFVKSPDSTELVKVELADCEVPEGGSAVSDKGSRTPYPAICAHKGGVIINRQGEIQFIKRKSEEFLVIWRVECEPIISVFAASAGDLILAATAEFDLLVVKEEKPIEIELLKSAGHKCDAFEFINPAGKHFITLCKEDDEGTIWEIESGEKVLNFIQPRIIKVTCISSLPTLPCILLGMCDGTVEGINVNEIKTPIMRTPVHVMNKVIEMIKPSVGGDTFCVSSLTTASFFVLRLATRNGFEVVAGEEFGFAASDYCYDERTGFEQLIILRRGRGAELSTFLMYKIDRKSKTFTPIEKIYSSRKYLFFLRNPVSNGFFAVPENSLMIDRLEYDGQVMRQEFSGHLLDVFYLERTSSAIITHGEDGIVTIRDSSSLSLIAYFLITHRSDNGFEQVSLNTGSRHLLTKGKDNSLIMYITGFELELPEKGEEDSKIKDLFVQIVQNPSIKRKRTTTLSDEASDEVKEEDEETVETESEKPVKNVIMESPFEQEQTASWVELEKERKLEEIRKQYENEKSSILMRLTRLKSRVQILITENENNSPEKTLSVAAFELDPVGRDRDISDIKKERETDYKFENTRIKKRDQISSYIRDICWNSIEVHSRELIGLCSNISVESYALRAESQEMQKKMIWLREYCKLTKTLQHGDFFMPWIPRKEKDLFRHIHEKWESEDSLEKLTHHLAQYTGKERMSEGADPVWFGSTSHEFITPNDLHLEQFHIATSYQAKQEIVVIKHDIRKLMIWFDEKFRVVRSEKEKKMKSISNRIERLNYIKNELDFFNCPYTIPYDEIPSTEWKPKEKPEEIVIVQEHELKNKPYMTHEEIKKLARLEAEAEERRLKFLADNFKQRALDEMMDGVIEKLWHEEIKKDTPKPKFMFEREENLWSEEEMKRARVYFEAEEKLQVDRSRYQKMLLQEMEQILLAIKEIAAQFDTELEALHELKLRVQSAIRQEELKIHRMKRSILEKKELDRKGDTIREQIKAQEQRVEFLQNQQQHLQDLMTDGRIALETILLKDKNLDKNFRKEFSEYSPVVCEQLYKLSKKRPKFSGKGSVSSTLLTEMCQSITHGVRHEFLPPECRDYLKTLDAMDSHGNAPAAVSESSWEHACKMRRIKIESELKIRSLNLDIAEAETSIAEWTKMIKVTKDDLQKLQAELLQVQNKITNKYHDVEVQVVLKQGQIEIPVSGWIADFSDAVMMRREDIESINEIILEVGEKKIKAMQKETEIRKGIDFKEWEHKKLCMKIEDLENTLDILEHVTVTKEMQDILSARVRGTFTEKGLTHLENEIAVVKERNDKEQKKIMKVIDSFEKKITDLTEKNAELDEKIIKLNNVIGQKSLLRDLEKEKEIDEEGKKRMKNILKRKRLLNKIHEQQQEIVLLEREMDLLHRRIHPTIQDDKVRK